MSSIVIELREAVIRLISLIRRLRRRGVRSFRKSQVWPTGSQLHYRLHPVLLHTGRISFLRLLHTCEKSRHGAKHIHPPHTVHDPIGPPRRLRQHPRPTPNRHPNQREYPFLVPRPFFPSHLPTPTILKSKTLSFSQTPFELDTTSLARYTTYSLLSSPPNILWQSWLESHFPGREPRNLATKSALDLTLGALANSAAFVVGMDMLRGERDVQVLMDAVGRRTWPLVVAGARVWPAASMASFALVPLEWRAGFMGLVGVGWNIWLCLHEGDV